MTKSEIFREALTAAQTARMSEDMLKPYAKKEDIPPVVQEEGTSKTAVMSQAAVGDLVVRHMQGAPKFVDSIADMKDRNKSYVLKSDGMIYQWTLVPGKPQYTNRIPPSLLPAGGGHFDLPGILLNKRYDSANEITTEYGTHLTGRIPVRKGDVIRFQNLHFRSGIDLERWAGVHTYGSGGGYLRVYGISDIVVPGPGNAFTDKVLDSDGCLVKFTVNLNTIFYLAVGSSTLTKDSIVTVNEEIVPPIDTYEWVSTGHAYEPADYENRIIVLEEDGEKTRQDLANLTGRVETLETAASERFIPAFWKTHLNEKAQIVRNCQSEGGSDCFSFISLCDLHVDTVKGDNASLGKRTGILARYMMDACDIPVALLLGDTATRACKSTMQDMEASFDEAEKILAPIRSQLLRTEGNHDGHFGQGGGQSYIHAYSRARMYERIYRKNSWFGKAVSSPGGMAFFADDPAARVRYVLLSSYFTPPDVREDNPSLGKYNGYRTPRFGQEQYDFLIQQALRVKEGWSIVIGSHVPVNDRYADAFAGDHVLMRNLLQAYNAHTEFSGHFPGTLGWDAVHVGETTPVRFTASEGYGGTVIGFFAGHTHEDSDGIFGIPVITHRCDGASENDTASRAERVAGTVTEHSFDVVTVNRAKRRIYCTKIGAGEDRVIPF